MWVSTLGQLEVGCVPCPSLTGVGRVRSRQHHGPAFSLLRRNGVLRYEIFLLCRVVMSTESRSKGVMTRAGICLFEARLAEI